jgi:hypothetical protein
MEGKFELQFEDNEYYLVDGNTNDTIASTDKVLLKEYDGYMKKLSLKNCQAVANGYDLNELAREACDITDPLRLDSQKYKQDPYFKIGFNKGFQKALEILGDKKFSEEDMKKAYLQSFKYEYFGDLIRTLQQTEWDVEVEMECVMGCQNLILNGENSVCCGDKKPKLDADGCLILKRK